MITVARTNDPSPHIQKRAKKMRVRTLSPFTYLVIPEPGHQPKIVHLDCDQETGVFKIECYDRETGEGCGANTFGLHCSHVERALQQLVRNANRAEKLDGAEPIERVRRVRKYARKIISETAQKELIQK